MGLEIIETVSEVMDELGGNPGIAELTGAKPSAISMWKKAGNFPLNTYLIITDALHARGKTAPVALWGMKSPADPERVA